MAVDFKQRNQEIVALRDCGQSYANIGVQFGICPSRVMEIYKKEKNRIASETLIDTIEMRGSIISMMQFRKFLSMNFPKLLDE